MSPTGTGNAEHLPGFLLPVTLFYSQSRRLSGINHTLSSDWGWGHEGFSWPH